MSTDLQWMQQAYILALQAKVLGEVPVGAILVDATGQCLGQGYNQVIHRHDPTAHAELLALQDAATRLQNHRLCGLTLYVTLEPCPMCAGAIVHSRIDRLVFAARDCKTGAAGSVYQLLSGELLNHRVRIDEGVMEAPCSALLKDFFQKLRSYKA